MKKILLLAAICCSTAVFAQRVNVSTWTNTDLSKYDGKVKDITMYRYMFQGWNTFCVPFSMTEEQINEAFGTDCKVETLVGVEGNANEINAYFNDVKRNGIEPNKPYIIYYSGESANKHLLVNRALVNASGVKTVEFETADGSVVALTGTLDHKDGLQYYGIMAKDNSESKFVAVQPGLNGFYPTRCYLSVNRGNEAKVNVLHGEPMGIKTIDNGQLTIDNSKTYNLNGVQVKSGYKGVIIQNGKKRIAK